MLNVEEVTKENEINELESLEYSVNRETEGLYGEQFNGFHTMYQSMKNKKT